MVHHIWIAVVVIVGVVATIFDCNQERHLHYHMLQKSHAAVRPHTKLDLQWCSTSGVAEGRTAESEAVQP